MFTFAMSFKEMYDNLAADKRKVDIFVEKQRAKVIKLFEKERKFPNSKWFEYTVPASENKYIVYFYAEFTFQAKNPIFGSYFYDFFDGWKRYDVQWSTSPYKFYKESEIVPIRQLMVYTVHFLQQYMNRFLKKDSISANEVAAIFMARNPTFTPIHINKNINRNADGYGDNNFGIKVRDGFCFAERIAQVEQHTQDGQKRNKLVANCFVLKTFLSKQDMDTSQTCEIERQNNEAWDKFRKDILSKKDTSLQLKP